MRVKTLNNFTVTIPEEVRYIFEDPDMVISRDNYLKIIMARTTAKVLASERGGPGCLPKWLETESAWLEFAYTNDVPVKEDAYMGTLKRLEIWVNKLVPHK